MRRFGRRWWIPGAAVVVAFGVDHHLRRAGRPRPALQPLQAAPGGPDARPTCSTLAQRAGVDVGQVYEIDASRRTTAANAYVTGLGHTKRVVLYDNLLKDFTPAELRLVVAHELGHVRHRDVPRGLLYLLIVAPFGMFAVARLGERLAPEGSAGTPLALPGDAARGGARLDGHHDGVQPALTRRRARADAFALELTGEPETQIAFQRKIALQNVSDPDPPGWVTFLLGTHPPTIERIGQAEAAARASSREG